MNEQKNTFGHSVVWAFLLSVLFNMNAMSASLTDQIAKDPNQLTLQPYELFARKDISGAGGIHKFLSNEDDKATGLINIKNGILPTNEIFIFNEISVGYAKGATGKAGALTYGTPLPGEVRNCEFEIVQNGKAVVNMPIASLNNPYDGTTATDAFTAIGSLAYLIDNVSFEIFIKFPTGVSVLAGETTNFHYLEVRLRGWRTVRKAA